MSEDTTNIHRVSSTESELYFLIERFLSTGPCQEAAEVLRHELHKHGLLPKRLDWEGREHKRSYENLIESNSHIRSDHLLKICERVGPLLDKELKPSVCGVASLLGAGSFSLLRTAEGLKKTKWSCHVHAVLQHQNALLPPQNLATPLSGHVLTGRELSGAFHFNHMVPVSTFNKVTMLGRKLGHLSAVYCILYDRSGKFIFTGADDHLVKIWRGYDGRLLATLRGHSAEITDMAVNYENTLLATGSCDKTIRIWCLKTKAPVTVLSGHTGMITSLKFSPFIKGDSRYLSSTGGDGCVCFWEWNAKRNSFHNKPIKFIERSRAGAQMLCSSFSPGGAFLATGSADHVIRVYFLHAGIPEKICELEAHTDRVDSIGYANAEDRFVSGSRDGTARIWRYERQEWKNIVLNMSTKLQDTKTNEPEENKSTKLKVTMVGWNMDDKLVVTAVNDLSLRVWDASNGKLLHILKAHEDEVFVLEPSPVDRRIMLSAGHDGNVFIWDIISGSKVKGFFNMIEGQGHGAVFDCKFASDGLNFAATDSHGHLILYGFGTNEKHKKIPQEVFFHTDYRPLIRDANNFVLDEQTQQAPHLMPPPFLVDIDGNPYPPALQRLVPGREWCKEDQLVPQMAVNEEGEQEVLGDIEPVQEEPSRVVISREQQQDVAVVDRPIIDQMIQELQRQQDQRIAREGGEPIHSPPPPGGSPRVQRLNSVAGGNAHMVGMRRVGETEGVRQSLGNISQRATKHDIAAWSRRIVVKPLDPAILRKNIEFRLAMAEEEMHKFLHERKKKPLVLYDCESSDSGSYMKTRKKKRVNHTYSTRAVEAEETSVNRLTRRALYDTEEEPEAEAEEESEIQIFDGWGDSASDGDTSEYSDWMGDTGSNLQPPTRTSRRVKKRKRYSSSEELESDSHESRESRSKKSKKKPPAKKKKPPNKKKKHGAPAPAVERPDPQEVQTILEKFRPPDWLTDTIPRKTPYFPQMGDELMYFRQGHENYVNAVKRHNVYDIGANHNQPWHKNPQLREQEFVKIIGIKYEIRPPRLCCLKLAYLDPVTSKPSGGSFSVKYHDMPDVIDFLVLKQIYDIAMKRKWKPGDRFRSMIDDAWWLGTIEAHVPLQAEFPDSMFQCFRVHWDNGEIEQMSPWDMEPIDSSRCNIEDGTSVTPEELKALLYAPKPGEWPGENRDIFCSRVIHGLERFMEHSLAEDFLTPVDLNLFPSYAMHIEYPTDLNTIKARLENRFYRRVTSLQFDVRYIESNAQKFNEPNSLIVKRARIVTETLLKFIADPDCDNPIPILAELGHVNDVQDGNSSNENSDDGDENSQSRKRKRKEEKSSNKRAKLSDPEAWKSECQELLDRVFQWEDSEPFREPVDANLYPQYYEVIDNPMDLHTVRNKLAKNGYTDPQDIIKDVRLIFHNSKLYNTNKRSRIYAMTLRLSAMLEEQLKEIISNWKTAIKNTEKHSQFTNRFHSTRSKSASNSGHSSKHSSLWEAGPSTSAGSRGSNLGKLTNGDAHSSGDETEVEINEGDDDDDDDDDETEIDENYAYLQSQKLNPPRAKRAIRRPALFGHDNIDGDDSEVDVDQDDENDKDYKVRSRQVSPKKKSPKKKAPAQSKSHKKSAAKKSILQDSSSTRSSEAQHRSYSTRAATGTIKRRRYDLEGFFTDEDEEKEYDSSNDVESSKNSDSENDTNSSTSSSSSSSCSNSSDSESDSDTCDRTLSKKSSQGIRRSLRAAAMESSPSVRSTKPVTKHDYAKSSTSSSQDSGIRTRFQGRRTVKYEEDSDDDSRNKTDSDSSRKNSFNVSSRGRVRKMTARARASLLRE
ncbi:hypothetical protein ACJMK2_028102 [Sinanodonta woodiana]|uniref:Bromo domain-containing protein n=1 Tax=Sinanodonta woodiana TaxID=1069815 RepID=A0ABD3X630_SINWO